MISAVAGGCAAGIALLIVTGPLLIAATTWPAYVLSVLQVSRETAQRLERTVVRTSLALLVVAAAATVFLLVDGC